MATGSVMQVAKYQNDTMIWTGYPEADMYRLFPVKGFCVKEDSTLIKAPHINDKTWYKGQFNKKGALYGIHEIFYIDGSIRARINYKMDTLIEFEPNGKIKTRRKFLGTP
jgi:hypothetical protein